MKIYVFFFTLMSAGIQKIALWLIPFYFYKLRDVTIVLTEYKQNKVL